MKYYVRRTNAVTKEVHYKNAKCLDTWSRIATYCWRYSKQGAKRIADRYTKNEPNGSVFIYDIVPVEEV